MFRFNSFVLFLAVVVLFLDWTTVLAQENYSISISSSSSSAAVHVEEQEQFKHEQLEQQQQQQQEQHSFLRALQRCAGRGGICDYDRDCCGNDLCSGRTCRINNNVCKPNGGTCARTDDCCDPWHCISNTCQSGTIGGSCFDNGLVCILDSDCCNQRCRGGRCDATGGGINIVCGILEDYCQYNDDCCAGFTCNGNRCRSTGGAGTGSDINCNALWTPCLNNAGCCYGLHCRENLCDRPQCGVNGQTCRTNFDCCETNTCVNGFCQGSGGILCKPLDNTCYADVECCGDYICNKSLASGTDIGRCTIRGSVTNACSNSPGAACRSDQDCCGPNNLCDRYGKYCQIHNY